VAEDIELFDDTLAPPTKCDVYKDARGAVTIAFRAAG